MKDRISWTKDENSETFEEYKTRRLPDDRKCLVGLENALYCLGMNCISFGDLYSYIERHHDREWWK